MFLFLHSVSFLYFFFFLNKTNHSKMYDNFIIVNKSKSIIEQEPNPFEQSFAAVSPPKFEFIQVNQKWASDNCSYKSNAGTVSSADSDDVIIKSKPSTSNNNSKPKKPRRRAPRKFDCEEKRREFLERNRIAALKCRQRKKQWLANLQARVDFLIQDNEHLELETNELKKEIMTLKQLLLTHKDCPHYNMMESQEKQSLHVYLTSEQQQLENPVFI
ncbi:hypothetical protein CU097_003369 [Rhizopus azygosporus]|uniref:BZIP domain-containing protein n=1 Tax=Rhizopus azygosporus TaxID=86630 RepID=A0A367JN18_RHIAZ|nr:hypothetical protein CU097_003369 [Rhizopus azygosporus]CEI99526.1 Putative Activating transcription factor, other eukaryote [Rhizopus microsporus]